MCFPWLTQNKTVRLQYTTRALIPLCAPTGVKGGKARATASRVLRIWWFELGWEGGFAQHDAVQTSLVDIQGWGAA